MKRDEDDLISQLLDETYEVTSHPGKELSFSKEGGLADHFERMASQYEVQDQPALGKIYFLDNFIRVEIHGEKLDIPNAISPFEVIENSSSEQVLYVTDSAFGLVLENLTGVPIKNVSVRSNSDFYPSNFQFIETKKKFAA